MLHWSLDTFIIVIVCIIFLPMYKINYYNSMGYFSTGCQYSQTAEYTNAL